MIRSDTMAQQGVEATQPEATPRTVIACVIGNTLEWYDFTAYTNLH